MQLSKSLLLAVVALSASASAAAVAPQGRSHAVAARDMAMAARMPASVIAKRFGSPVVPVITSPEALVAIETAIADIQAQIVALKDIKTNFEGNVAEAKAVFEKIASSFTTLTSTLANLPAVVPTGAVVAKRQDPKLVPALKELSVDVQAVLISVQTLVDDLLDNIDASELRKVVDPVVSGVMTLVGEITDALNNFAPDLAIIVDPILDVLSKIVDALDLPLPQLPSAGVAADASASA